MNDRPIRVGILGAARIAPSALIEPARERQDLQVVTVAARDRARAEEFADRYELEDAAHDYTELIERDDLDLIYVALPPDKHCRWTIAALEAGKSVLCEKPFATNVAEAEAMVAAGRTAGVTLIEAFHYRFHPLTHQAVSLLRDGAIGRPCRAIVSVDYPIPVREGEPRWSAERGGGAMMDLGCYGVHALRTLLGAEPDVVEAAARCSRGVDAATTARLLFPYGVEAELHTAMDPAAPFTQILIEGTRGRLQMNGFVLPHRSGRLQLSLNDEIREFPVSGITSYEAQLDHVVALLRGKAAPLTGGEDAVANMRVIDRIRTLSRGRDVGVPITQAGSTLGGRADQAGQTEINIA